MSITGKIGNLINLTGAGLSIVTDVLFNNSSAEFEVIDDSFLSIRVPTGASHSKIRLVSRLSDPPVTGETSAYFTPLPEINYLDNYTGYFKNTVSVYGDAFTEVTGVKLNNLTCSFSVINNNNLSFVVPSGDVRGPLKVFGREGLTAESTFNFIPVFEITGFQPSNPKTGDILRISGKYFLDELSLTGKTGYFAVQFFGENSTGLFGKLNSFILTGLVPTGARSGDVTVLM